MEFTIQRADEAEVPTVHRQAGAVVNQVANELTPFVKGAALGEWFSVEVENVAVFVRGLLQAASDNGVGVTKRLIVNDPERTKPNRAGEPVLDENQSGKVWFAFAKKREGVGRKPKGATAKTSKK